MTTSETTESPARSTRYDASEWECRGCGFVLTALMRCTRKDGDRCPRCNAYRWQVAPWLKPIAAENRAANRRKIDPFIGVWDDDFVHECTWCGYLLAEIERRLLQCPVCCPRCAGDRWTEYKGFKSCTESGQTKAAHMNEPVQRVFTVSDKITGSLRIFMESKCIGQLTPIELSVLSQDEVLACIHDMVADEKERLAPVPDYQI